MIACLSPSNQFLEENVSTLNYAMKASYISNIPLKNQDPKMMLVNELKDKVSRLEHELKTANDHIQYLSSLNPGAAPLQTTNAQPLQEP
mmetsp:Transcript_31179/g.47726  ORF Transcript_31179/g.47726 Transcript_31179/m.47726 type:complete len:89 (+) Transcript_31179:939-1205(+)